MKRFSITEPCSQDWYQMAPVEKGAFCSNCQKNVIDFTTFSLPDLKQFLAEHRHEKICGRIANQQLDALNLDYEDWENQNHKTFLSKFLLALLITFGLSLFSCKNAEDVFIETTFTPTLQVEESPEMAFEQPVRDTIVVEQNQPDSNIILFPQSMAPLPEMYITWVNGITMGCLAMPPDWILEAEEANQKSKLNSITVDFAPPYNHLEKMLIGNTFEVVDFPEMTSSTQESIVILSKTMEPIHLVLRDEKGKEKFSYDSWYPMIGENQYTIDFSSCERGIYFLCISQGEYEKIVPIEVGNNAI